MIEANLNQPGHLGLPEFLRCTGFRTNIDLVSGDIISIDFFYSKIIKGNDGAIQETSSHVKTYSNVDLRQDIDLNTGQRLFQNIEVPVLDELTNEPVLDNEGNPVLEIQSVPVLIGTVDFWLKTIGNAYILPDLQTTLNSRIVEHKRL